MNAPTPTPTELQLDALREVANVGCGQAASALSRLLGGRQVGISVPRAVVVPLGEVARLLGGEGAPVVAATLEMSGGLSGHVLLVLSEAQARLLAGLLLGAPVDSALAGFGESALAETANIVASACLNAISRMSGLRLLPSPPTLDQDVAQEVVRRALVADVGGDGRAVVLEASFQTQGVPGLEGQLLIIPGADSVGTLLTRLGV